MSCVISSVYAEFSYAFEPDVAVPVVVMLFGAFTIAAIIVNVVMKKKFADKE